jgi:glyoxylase-like metal-dependent hydrolase (beta-lactamase superfamily II)
VRTGRENVLVDTGIGTKWGPRERDMYGIAHETSVPESLQAIGLSVDDIDVVICTHLHFDHAGGNTRRTEGGEFVPTFPRARYVVQEGELRTARRPHDRERASYLPENWEPLVAANVLETIDGDGEIVPGVRVVVARGHNDYTQLVEVASADHTAVFLADIVPTTRHLRPAWVMGYDLYPVELVDLKKRLLGRAADESWMCVFEHDQETPMARVGRNDKGTFEVIGDRGSSTAPPASETAVPN